MSSVLNRIRLILAEKNCSAVLINKNNAHRSEYINLCENYMYMVSKFTGSNGFIIVTMTDAVIFVDGRYTLQAQLEINPKFFQISDYNQACITQWMIKHITPYSKILYNPMLTSVKEHQRYKELASCNNWALKASNFDFINLSPSFLDTDLNPEIVDYPVKYAGQSRHQKIEQVITYLNEHKLDGLFLNTSESIAWLFNIRSPKKHYIPAPHCYAYISEDNDSYCFVSQNQMSAHTKALLDPVKLELKDHLSDFIKVNLKNKKVALDTHECPVYWYNLIKSSGAKPTSISNPINDLKSVKNNIEILGSKNAHICDGAAVCTTIFWLKHQISKQIKTSEIDVEQRLLFDRQQHSILFKGVSFDSIVGAGSNGAIIHYHATQKTNRMIKQEDVVLIDSGGHYLNGTTDITRTLYMGNNPSSQLKKYYTLVLKGHIALAQQVFPEGTTGSQLDILARQFLWQQGLNYAHGTGHGVGSYLSVHEGPQNISSAPNNIRLKPGMILSNEPGFYLENCFGIRLENLIVVEPSIFNGYLNFFALTLVPYEPCLIEQSLLTKEEILWINQYHQKVFQNISPLVSLDVQEWLKKITGPLG